MNALDILFLMSALVMWVLFTVIVVRYYGEDADDPVFMIMALAIGAFFAFIWPVVIIGAGVGLFAKTINEKLKERGA